jgi:hypothetical protein
MAEAIDLPAAHRHFSTMCFNAAWEVMERPDRSPDDNQEMIRLAFASLWHWSQRQDVKPRHFAVGYWQIARIFALLGMADASERYARHSLEQAEGYAVGHFYRGYAHEALARAALVRGDRQGARAYLAEALAAAEMIADKDERQLLLQDLAQIQQQL